jgi:hypothetical protein
VIIPHVYRPFATVRYTSGDTEEERRYVVLRFGLDAADAAKSTDAYLYTIRERKRETWEDFVLRQAQIFLACNFKEY